MPKLTTAQPPYTLLVANLTGGGDPSKGESGNPVKARTSITYQHFPEIPNPDDCSVTDRIKDPSTPGLSVRKGLLTTTTPGLPVSSSGTITVSDNDFTDPAIIHIGKFTLTSDEDYTVGANTTATATAIASAIDGLPGFSASSAVADVTITGPFGIDGNDIRFEVIHEGSVENFTLSPDDGSLGSAEPTIGPPTIT